MPGQLLDFDGRPFVFGANGTSGGPFLPHDLVLEDTFQPPVVPGVQDIAAPPSILGLLGSSFFVPFAADPPPPLNLNDWFFPGVGSGPPPSNGGLPGPFGTSRGSEVPGGDADPAPPLSIHDWLSSLFGAAHEPTPGAGGILDSLFG